MNRILRLSCLLVFTFLQDSVLLAQLDTIHWIPPIYARNGAGPQYVYLSTQEQQPFTVTIRDGAGKVVKAVDISRDQPFEYDLGDTYSQLIVPAIQLHKPLPDHGLVLSGAKQFYAAFRAYTANKNDAMQLTCKGRAALGRTFRIAQLYQLFDKTGSRSNCVGIMATEDATVVTFSGFNPITLFRIGFAEKQMSGPVQVVLQKGETIVFAQHVHFRDSDQPPNGFMGALIEATKPVAVNCGSWIGAPVVYEQNDIGIDQIAPLERIGKEYVLSRGNGPTSIEHPIVIAHYNGTQVWLNGDTTPVATLNAGEYLIIPASTYLPTGNVFIRASEPVFMYQMIGGLNKGKDRLGTVSLLFVPPLNCGIAHSLGPLFIPTCIGAMCFDANLAIIALRDAGLTIQVDGFPFEPGPPLDLPGNKDFVVYRPPALFHNGYPPDSIWVSSNGPVQVTLVGNFKESSFAALYSGFEPRSPEVKISHIGDGICPDTLVASGFFDGIEWIYSNSILQIGPDSQFIVSAPGTYIAAAYIGGCYSTALVYDTIQVPLNAPTFPYMVQDASCFGVADGQIEFGTPNGGVPPYRFSINFGQLFSSNALFDHIAAGYYKLVVQDAIGCYNEPIELQLRQPDSFYVNIQTWQLKEPLQSGDLAVLDALPSHPVGEVYWSPADSAGCTNCLQHAFYPDVTTMIGVTVVDSDGCMASDNVLLVVDPRIYAPNALTVRSTQGNDRFTLFSKEPLPIQQLVIYDRWGNAVFERRDFLTNQTDSGWDGTVGEKQVETGVYIFWARVEIEPGRTSTITGDIFVHQRR